MYTEYTNVEMIIAVAVKAKHCVIYGKSLLINVGNNIIFVNIALGFVNETIMAPLSI